MIKLVAMDMDGTLLDSKKRLPKNFFAWVNEHPNIKTVIASGRQYYCLLKDFVPVKDKIVFLAENGGLVFYQDEVIYSNPMNNEATKQTLKKVLAIDGLHPVICGVNSAYMLHSNEHVEKNCHIYYEKLEKVDDLFSCIDNDEVVKISCFVDDHLANEKIKLITDLDQSLCKTVGADEWIDITEHSVNKGNALRAILEKWNIDKKESMAFGDYLNDYELLLACEESYCMENGHDDLKKVSKHLTLSNDEDGVMYILNDERNLL